MIKSMPTAKINGDTANNNAHYSSTALLVFAA
jgi:hypothetical protein